MMPENVNSGNVNKVSKTKIFLLIGIFCLLILSVGFVLIRNSKTVNQTTSPENFPLEIAPTESESSLIEQYPQELAVPTVADPQVLMQQAKDFAQEFKDKKEVVEKGNIGNKSWEVNNIGDPANPMWIKYQLQNVEAVVDITNKSADVSWTDQNLNNDMYAWMVGYWYTPFDPMEKFQVDKLTPDQQIIFSRITRIENPQEADAVNKKLTLDLKKFPDTANTVYFYIYLRTKTPDGKYTDYIYGANNTADQPYTKTY